MSNISSTVSNSLIAGTDESDSIYSSGDSVTIAGGGGADSIDNYGSNVSIDGGSGNDTIKNGDTFDSDGGDNVSINGGADSDYIVNSGGDNVTLDGGEGADVIINGIAFSNDVMIAGGEGDDTIDNCDDLGLHVTVDGGVGNDSIYSSSAYSSITGGVGNDSIDNWGSDSTVDGGADNDSIENSGSNVSIIGGTGNDLISLSSNAKNNVIVFSANDGNDTVIGFNETSTIRIGEDGKGIYSTQISGDDIVATVADDKGKITLSGAATLEEAVSIEGTFANVVVNRNSNKTVRGTSDTLKPDAIYNHGHDVTIQALGGNDTILNYGVAPSVTSSSYGSNVSINAGNGDDSISNNGRYSVLNGGNGNDSITNTSWGINSTILGSVGDDKVWNYADNVSINVGNGDNTVDNRGNNVTVRSGTGNDFIWNDPINGGANSLLADAGAGNDTISSWGNDSTLIGGEGDDKIINYTNGYVDGKPVVEGVGKNVSISGGAGNDSIDNRGSNVTITGGEGRDTIINNRSGNAFSLAGAYSNIDAGADNDYIENNAWCDYSFIDGATGADTVLNHAAGSTISGGAGNDSIKNTTGSVSINGGEGDDTIEDTASIGHGNTIVGGLGNDSISLGSNADNLIAYSQGDGNDLIQGFQANSTLQIADGTGTYSSTKSGDNVIVTVGDGKITLEGSASLATLNIDGIFTVEPIINTVSNTVVNGTAYDDTITNSGSNVTITGGTGHDSIYNNKGNNITIDGGTDNDIIYNEGEYGYGDVVSINGGTGNDSISNHYGVELTIDAGDGNDTIQNNDRSNSINGGAGDDVILNTTFNNLFNGHSLTVEGGTGNDSIDNNGGYYVLFKYTAGDGNDTITGFNATSTLSIGSNGFYSTVTSDNNIIVTTTDGRVTLQGVASLSTVNISGDFFNPIDNRATNTVVSGTSGQDSIYNYGVNPTVTSASIGSYVSINSGDGKDRVTNDGRYALIDGGNGNDTLANTNWGLGATFLGGNGNDFISTYNSDSVSIDGGADNDTIDVRGAAKDVTVTGGKGNDSIKLNGGGNLVQYKPGDGNDIIEGFTTTDTLSIGGSCSSAKSSDNKDVIITVGDGNITLTGAASLETLNIIVEPVTQDGGESINNTVSNTVVNGTTYDDTITNSGSNVTINALAGNDSISLDAGAKNNLLVYKKGDGSDTVSGFKTNDTVSIVGSSKYSKDSLDNDFIISMVGGGKIVLKDAASLSSVVNIKGGKETIIGGMEITNNSTGNLVNGTNARDTLINHAGGATILAGSGNDYIDNSTDAKYMLEEGLGYVTIDAGAGNDTIFSYDPNVSISGGANADLISLKSSNFSGVTVNAGTGNDIIYGNANDYGVLYEFRAGDGFDTIYYFGSNDTLSIEGDTKYTSDIDGDNVVVSVEGGGQITLIDAAGKDIYIYPPDSKYLINSNDNSLISGSSSADTIKNTGDFVTINAGKGHDTIYNNCGDDTSINAGTGNDSIYGNNSRVTINSGTGNDTITGNHWRSNLNGDTGNDLISITTYWYNTLDGGTGDDSIIAGGSEHSVNGGADADFISLSGDKLTVAGGTGDDTIYGNTATSHLYEYAKGDGNDIIYNYGSNDSITISGSTWTTSTSGNNVIVNVADSGNITLDGAKDKTLNIYPNSNPTVAPVVTAQDVIKKFMGSLDTTASAGKAALDQAVSVASGGYFANVGAAIEQMTLDCAAAGNATTFLKDYCGIDLDNDDTGAITGSDAGGSSVKTAQSIVPEEGDLDSFTGNTFTTNGLTVQLANFNDKDPYGISYSSLKNETEEYIWQAFKTWWAGGALDLIAESYGDNFGFGSNSSATVKDMYFSFVNDNNNTLATTWNWFYIDNNKNPIDGKAIQLAMTVNMKYYGATTIGNVDGKSSVTSALLDRTLAHEMTHAVMAANIDYFNNLPQFIKEGMAELTHGIDDQRGNVIEYLAKDATALNNSLSLLDIGTGTVNAYAGGYMFLRYLAKQAAEHYPTASNVGNLAGNFSVSRSESSSNALTVTGELMTVSKDFTDDAIDLMDTDYASIETVDATALAKGIEITGNINANSIEMGVGNDTVFANVGNDTLHGGAGDDVLYGEAGNDKIDGDAGDDTLCGGSGNDTLTGGEGKDLFVHVADNDVITDYKADEDKIQLVEGNIVSSSVSGSDLVLDAGRYGLITVTGGASKNITVIDGDGNETTISPIAPIKIKKYTNSSAAKVTLSSTYDIADATARTKAIRIVGNAKDNSILGGSSNDTLYGKDGNDYLFGNTGDDKLYGQNGADTLWGGTGNDLISLASSAKNNVIVYTEGDGSDKVYGFNETSTLRIGDGTGTYSTQVSGTSVIVEVGDGKVTLNKAASLSTLNIEGTLKDDKSVTLTSGNDKYTNDVEGVTIEALGGKDTVVNNAAKALIDLGTGNDTLTNKGADVTIFGGTGNDTLRNYSGGKNSSIIGDAGADKIYNSAASVTMFGGTGNDLISLASSAKNNVIAYSDGDGNDKIYGFNADDTLQIGDGTGTYSTQVSGTSIIVKVGKGTVTLNKAASLATLNIAGSLVGTKTETFDDNSAAKVTLAADTDIGDASARTKAVRIVGNAKDNSILGGSGKDTLYGKDGDDYLVSGKGSDKLYGQDGDDTLWGGTGNDTLIGGAGADTFVYNAGDGKDVITDFIAKDDMLQITGTFSAKYYSSSDKIVFKVGSTASALTLKDISVTSATTFNINGDTYKISGTKLVKK